MSRFDTISFLSDYGTTDEFVGVVHSVIRQLSPDVGVIDVTHEIAPYDVKSASLTLARSAQYLAPGVVLAIVDPGVGTARRAVAIEVTGGEAVFVGPDNGLLAAAVAMVGGATRAVELTNPDYQLAAPGPTFAGRDIFAPAAAHICRGVDLGELGPEVDPLSLLPGTMPITREVDGTLFAEVLWVDRYGNLQLNVDPAEIEAWGERLELRFHGRTRSAGRQGAYAGVGVGDIGLVVDSYGLISVGANRSSAAEELGIRAGDEVVLAPLDENDQPPAVTTPVSLGRKPEGPR